MPTYRLRLTPKDSTGHGPHPGPGPDPAGHWKGGGEPDPSTWGTVVAGRHGVTLLGWGVLDVLEGPGFDVIFTAAARRSADGYAAEVERLVPASGHLDVVSTATATPAAHPGG